MDDFREAYYWLNQNTDEDAKILAWWDYGYQLAGMSNRTTVVDNNTWNFTHIGYVGKVLMSTEAEAHAMCSDVGLDYVMVSFGGFSGMKFDDHIKTLWYARIAHDAFPEVKEFDYYKNGKFGVSEKELSDKYASSLVFKLMYNRFGEIQIERDKPRGWDFARKE